MRHCVVLDHSACPFFFFYYWTGLILQQTDSDSDVADIKHCEAARRAEMKTFQICWMEYNTRHIYKLKGIMKEFEEAKLEEWPDARDVEVNSLHGFVHGQLTEHFHWFSSFFSKRKPV